MIISRRNVIGAAVSILAITGCMLWAYKAGQKDVQTDWDAYALEQTQEYIRLSQEAAKKQAKLNSFINDLRGKYETETQNLRNTVTDLNNRLRERPTRPTTNNRMPEATTVKPNSKGCTGKELYKEDGQFLIGEAERADTLRQLLIQCRAAYESIRQQ